ncbi:VOC family protein [Deinococcus sp.]|uniref:VOC family protein n=1 Tax=Deinococcus sp. TaxID=47478 RepID=UPI003C7BE9AD
MAQRGVTAHLDHLVIAAADLASGCAWLEDRLGLKMQPGGEHPYFGTHNALLGLRGGYLEVIAVNAAAPDPPYPRWFGLDTPAMKERLAAGPALIHWVASVGNLRAALRLSPEDHGEALALSRGNSRWQLSVPQTGALPMSGVLPSLIQWESVSPAARLQPSGLWLERLSLSTPAPARLERALEALGFTGTPLDITEGPPHLEAILSINGKEIPLA